MKVLVYANIPNYEEKNLIAVKRDNLQHGNFLKTKNIPLVLKCKKYINFVAHKVFLNGGKGPPFGNFPHKIQFFVRGASQYIYSLPPSAKLCGGKWMKVGENG